MSFKDNIDLQIGTYPNALRTLRRASIFAVIAGLFMIWSVGEGFFQHKPIPLVFIVLGPYLLVHFGSIAWRTGKELRLREEQGAKNV